MRENYHKKSSRSTLATLKVQTQFIVMKTRECYEVWKYSLEMDKP